MTKKLTGFLDIDAIKYKIAFAGQKSSIKAIHKQSGDEYTFKTRTDFWGRGKNIGGWLANDNLLRESPRQKEEFDIEDVVVPEVIDNVLYSAKHKVSEIISQSGVSDWKGYIGKGDSFRVEYSTLLKYKSGRNPVKPYHFDAVTNYLETKYRDRVEIVRGLEPDDRVCMECTNKPNNIALIAEKDYYGCELRLFNFDKQEQGIVDCRGLGNLYRDDKGEVRGKGRLWKYFQACSSDKIDTYASNCFSDKPWGSVSAYEKLKDCKDDKEAWQTMYDIFKYLYPEPKKVIGWRGDEIEIDAMYVFNEVFNLAHLWRKENDFINVKNVLDKLGVNCD